MEGRAGNVIVTGFDGSDSARDAAHWAADEARRRNVPLRMVTAVTMPVVGYPVPSGLIRAFIREECAKARAELTVLKAEILRAEHDLDVHMVVRVGLPASVLINQSTEALLMVLGSRGLGGFSGLLVGSTAVALTAHGHCPVAVIRPGTPDGPVVVGVDGSPAADGAVALAFEEASLRGAQLVAVHAWQDYTSDIPYEPTGVLVADRDQVVTQEHQVLAQRLAGWQEKYPDVPVRRVVAQDRPARCLLEHAATAHVLVVGSRGRGGFAGLLLGSTSQALVHHAPCPLLVCRAGAG